VELERRSEEWNEPEPQAEPQPAPTSIDKAFEVCEALSQAARGLSISDLRRQLGQPAATIHRLLAVLKRRGYVQQDDDTSRYRLSLKMLDLSVRLLGRSELRLHAYPALREVVLRTGWRAFLATAADSEVTYVWSAGPDDVAMHTTYGRPMPGHCALYFSAESARRLSCLRMEPRGATIVAPAEPRRLGPARTPAAGAERAGQHQACTCAPVIDYAGREVARVGLFAHDLPDATLTRGCRAEAGELARLISLRLGGTLAPPSGPGLTSPVDPS
jgi:DNA-binding IclR family transcriptional regulator